jgi:hypothetical protein
MNTEQESSGINLPLIAGPAMLGLGVLGNKYLRAVKPLFGSRIGSLARQHGIGLKLTPQIIGKLQKEAPQFSDVINKIRSIFPESLVKLPENNYKLLQKVVSAITGGNLNVVESEKKFLGPVLDLFGRGRSGGRVLGYATSSKKDPTTFGVDSKLREAQLLKGFVEKTFGLKDIRNALKNKNVKTVEQLDELLKKKLGGDYLLKLDAGAQSKGLFLPKKIPKEQLLKYIQGKADKNINFDKYIIQKYRPIQSTSYMEDLASVGKMFLDPHHWFYTFSNPGLLFDKLNKSLLRFGKDRVPLGTKEYRVSALDGKVIPYSVNRKGIAGLYEGNYIWDKELDDIQKYTQKALDSLKAKNKQGLMGFDIGIDSRGKPFVIEPNPTVAGKPLGVSGAITDPMISSGIVNAIKGELPLAVKRQLALTMAPGLATTGVGLYNMDGNE